jgi:basic membrane protein A
MSARFPVVFRHFILVAVFALVAFASVGFADGKKLKVGLVLDKGGRDDKSFNSAAFQGATEAQKKLGIELKVVESSDDTALEPSLRTFAQRGYDLIVGIGFVQADAIRKVATDFPKIHFVLIDSIVELPNVRSVMFKEHEGAYLVGAIAALTTKGKAVGFVGGMDIPLIRRFELGYRSGAQATKPGIEVFSNYVGSTSDAWKNPGKGKELALSQYGRGADIIFAAAGASGLGVFDAAEETKKLVIGSDSNQNWVKPGRVLTSMLKRVDLAVYDAIESEQNGKFQAGTVYKGLAEKAVDFAVDKDNRGILTPEVEKKANAIRAKILSGQIKVPDYYETSKKPSKS